MCNMLEVAERSIVKMYPAFDLKEFRQAITQNGNLCELTYEMPNSMLGSVPIVTIDKRTCKVVRIIHTSEAKSSECVRLTTGSASRTS